MEACRVVLVRTQHEGNIGSVARVMRNMGVRDLALVAPEADHLSEQALALATIHGEPVLRSARVFPSLQEAVSDCLMVSGTSARTLGLYRGQAAVELPVMGPALAETMVAGPTALVFGPERTGLENDEALLCQWLVRIPAAEDYPVLNLAQAVGVCLYEVRRAWLGRTPGPGPDLAPYADQERMFGVLRAAMDRSQYLRGPGGTALWNAVRHLLSRAGPSAVEVRLLMGLARQLEWLSERAGL